MSQPGITDTSHVALPEPAAASSGSSSVTQMVRPIVRGKFLFAGDEKLTIKGVTYGTFRPGPDGEEYDRAAVEADFRMMGGHGINTVRVYTVPPRWLLDTAQANGLRVMVGLPWEQHITFLDSRKMGRSIRQRVREGVRSCAGHPAILCFTIGNEIPASIVRYHGARRVERFLQGLAGIVRCEDPAALVTYVNFPSTEYLQLGFLDFLAFNVYLESPDTLDPYLARLQNLAGEQPLLMAEIGLDSRRNGLEAQAAALDWQVRSVFAAGAAGAIVFAWTDEWHRGGFEIEDWDFGMVTRERTPKPALDSARRAFADVPTTQDRAWPRISVVVCSYNGSRTIADTLEGIRHLDYPDFETIVVDDGSTDNLAEIAARYDVQLIRTENQGLGAARNEGMRAATGEIVAYIDDDARPDPEWLRFIAMGYEDPGVVAVGGPNIAPPGDGFIAEAVAHAPGGPVHVLVTDTVADHLPGCNLTIRKNALEAIDGFDPRYRAAGDDVDVCWRLQERGGTLRYSPGAIVWHHRRNSAQAYWRQQHGYGKAEALLEEKWPQRYNALGHHEWRGQIYGNGLTRALGRSRGRIYHGIWGSAPFQGMYQPEAGLVLSLPLMPEWWLLVAAFAGLGLLGIAWAPLLWAWPLFLLAVIAPVGQALMSGFRAKIATTGRSQLELVKVRRLIAWFHLIQPIARLRGRLRFGLSPLRHPGKRAWTVPIRRVQTAWSETWLAPETWLDGARSRIGNLSGIVSPGGDYDTWDLDVRGGVLGSARVTMAIEEHGEGKQLARFRISPRPTVFGMVLACGLALLAGAAALDDAWVATVALGLAAIAVALRGVFELGTCTAITVQGLREVP